MDTTADPNADRFVFITQVYFCDAVVLWDWTTSLNREYRFIWKTHWTPVKIAYIFCRYWVILVVPYLLYCFVADHSQATCERIYKIPVALAMWNQVGSEAILLIRTYAFFSRSPYVLWSLLSALSGVVAYQLYVDTTEMLLLPFFRPPFDKGPCFPMSKPHSAHLLGFFMAPLLFDTLVTLMTVWRAINIRRCNGGPNSRLIQTFLREGIFYYILISIANLVNGVFYLQPRQVMSAINIPLSVMLGPVLACRLILDLKERGSETVAPSETSGTTAFTTKSVCQLDPPFVAPIRRSKTVNCRYHHRRAASSISTNIILTTLGSIAPDSGVDIERGELERDIMRLGVELHPGNHSGAGARDENELTSNDGSEEATPAPVYRKLGRNNSDVSNAENFAVSGIRVDVEKSSSSR